MICTCEDINDTSFLEIVMGLTEQLRDYQLLKKDSALRSWFNAQLMEQAVRFPRRV
jgi:hypothetical protein